METSIDRNRGERATEIRELSGYVLLVPSFTDDKSYRVSVSSGYCGCPHHAHKGVFCKHLILAESVMDARERRFGAYAAEEAVYRLCKRIFDRKPLAPRESYDLFNEVMGSPFSTPRMRRAAEVKHVRNVEHSEAA